MKQATTKIIQRLNSTERSGHETRFRLILLGAMGAITLFVLGRGLFDKPEAQDNFTNSTSASPGGHRALVELLGKNGFTVRTSVDRLDKLDDDYFKPWGSALALLEPSPEQVADHEVEMRALFRDERRPNVILVLPKRHYSPTKPDEDGRVVLKESIHSLADIEFLLEVADLKSDLSLRRGLETLALTDSQGQHRTRLHDWVGYPQYFVLTKPAEVTVENFMPTGWRILVQTSDGKPVAIHNAMRKLIVVADPDFLSNRYLAKGDAAVLAKNVFVQCQSREIVIDEAMHGLATQASLEYLAVRPPALWSLLSLLLLLGLFGWRETTVLQPALEEGDTRRSRAYVVEGVAKLMERARDYGPASRALIKRAQHALSPSKAHVHAAGMAGSTPTSLPKETETGLGEIKLTGGSEENFVAVATSIAKLKREQTFSKSVPGPASPGKAQQRKQG